MEAHNERKKDLWFCRNGYIRYIHRRIAGRYEVTRNGTIDVVFRNILCAAKQYVSREYTADRQ